MSLQQILLVPFLFLLAACGNGGHVDFNPDFQRVTDKAAGYSVVPASQALATGSGYTAKVQLNPLSGTSLQATNGYSARLKFTVRNR